MLLEKTTMAVKKQDDILKNLPASAADFIKVVIRNMRYRKAVQRDVKNELAAHFEDELKDCKDEKEKEQRAKQIIEDFGDPKLLGILLRRAKKRCRPLWRTAVVRSFQAAGILIICFIAYTVWFLIGKPVITTDYISEFNRLVRSAADESQNAAPYYLKAAGFVKNCPNDVKELTIRDWRWRTYSDFNTEDKQKLEKWLSESKEVFDLVTAGSKLPFYWEQYKGNESGELMSIQNPNFPDYLTLVMWMNLRAEIYAEQGRFEDSFGDLLTCYRFGKHLKGKSFLIESLVGIAFEARSVQTTRVIISTYQVEPAVLAEYQKGLEELVKNEDFIISPEGERLRMYDEIQRCFTDDGFLGGHIYPYRLIQLSDEINSVSKGSFSKHKKNELLKALGISFYVMFNHPGKQKTRQMVERFYGRMEELSQKTPAQIHIENIDIDKETLKLTKGNLLLGMLSPAFKKVFELSYGNRTDVQATIAILALQRYKQGKGQYPESLDELVTSGFLKELPVDPYSDKPLVYRKTEIGFTLYSVGKNFIDDGGKMGVDVKGLPRLWQDNGDNVFWPVQK
jgi:hypothetical protein